MEHATDKQKILHEARLAHEAARRNLEDKIASLTATPEDCQQVLETSHALKQAEEMRLCFDCGKGCEKPIEWTKLYQDLENENAHLKKQNEEYRVLIERERATWAAEIRNLQSELNLTSERAALIAGDLDVAQDELIEAQKEIENLDSQLLDAKERIASLIPVEPPDSETVS